MDNSHDVLNSTDRNDIESDKAAAAFDAAQAERDIDVQTGPEGANAAAAAPTGTGGIDARAEPPSAPSIVGTSGDDTLTGTDGPDVIFARAGDDVVRAGAGDDIVSGGPGADQLFGELDNDQLFGGPDNDTLSAGPGDDVLFGGPGDDFLSAGRTAGGLGSQGDLVFGGAGNDQIRMADVNDPTGEGGGTAYGGPGDDVIQDGILSSRLFGGPGNDTISGIEGSDVIYGGAGNDILSATTPTGAVGGAVLFGGAGNDRLSGGFATPAMHGGPGDDVLQLGQSEPDPRFVPAGFELVFDGGTGFDTLRFAPGTALSPGTDVTLSQNDDVNGIEQIVMLNAIDRLTVDRAGVLGASDETDTLIVDTTRQFDGGRIDAIGAWTQAGTQDVGGLTFDQWQLDGAMLLVNPSIDFHLL